MNEKDTALMSDDYGRDLASVQALQRKHEGLERDLAAVENKVSSSLLPLPPPSLSLSSPPSLSREGPSSSHRCKAIGRDQSDSNHSNSKQGQRNQ